MVRPAGLEPATTRLEGGCSIQLSYGRVLDFTFLVLYKWSGWRDSNPRHLAPKASALPDCATPRDERVIAGNFTAIARLLRRRFRGSGRRGLLAPRGRIEQRLSRQAHAALVVGLEYLHLHDLAFLEVIGDRVHALVGDLRDVQQAVLAGQQLHDRAEVQQAQHRALVDLADFHFGRDRLDAVHRVLARFGREAGDRDGAVVLDVDRG